MIKLHINITEGVLEVEGEEGFVREIYADFKDGLLSKQVNNPTDNIAQTRDTPKSQDDLKTPKKPKKGAVTSKPRGTKESYALVKDFDFTKLDRSHSLKEFYAEKQPGSYTDTNVVFVYYLKRIAKVDKVTLSYIYTCYDEVGARKPSAFKQSVADTSSKKGWLNTTSFEDIDVSIRGQNLVEHDLPKKVKEDK